MIKYLVKRGNSFWFRRKIKGYGEIVFSLQTKNYDSALVRHSYINYKINTLINHKRFHKMNALEIRELINKYKEYMLNEEYNDFEEQRDIDLTTIIKGQTYGGHTQEALEVALERYKNIHASNDINAVKKEVDQILKRSNLQEDFKQLETEKEKVIFYWELFKAEWELLYKSYEDQKTIVPNTEEKKNESDYEKLARIIDQYHSKTTHTTDSTVTNDLKINELLELYIKEKEDSEGWSDRNTRDIRFVLNHFISYHNNCHIHELGRKHFVDFRDNVLKNLPKNSQDKRIQNKSTKQILKIVKKEKLEIIGISTLNKHLGRVHQVFEWAENSGYIQKNYSKDLRIKEKNKSKKKKAAKIPYNKQELENLFEKSPCFSFELERTLQTNPERVFIPLLALFTGAKPMELGLLKTTSITEVEGVIGIDFNQMIKNVYTERFTPLSMYLLDLGFLKYVDYMKNQNEEKLFPAIKEYRSGISFTNFFSAYNKKYVTEDPKKTFYSLRHLVNQKLKDKKTRSYIINDILGHAHSSDQDEEVYGGEHEKPKVLQETINECLIYNLDFSFIKTTISKIF